MSFVEIPILTELTRGDCYTISYDIAAADAEPSMQMIITIGYGAYADQNRVCLAIEDMTSGTHTIDFNYPGSGLDGCGDPFRDIDYDTLYIQDFSVPAANLGTIKNLEINLQEQCADTYCSECYNISSCQEGMLLQWTNDDNGLGFNYAQLGFIQQLRVNGGLRIPTGFYDDETYYSDSKGDTGILYAQAIKQQELWIESIPEYLHDAIRVAIAHDHFFIDGVEYVKLEGGYAPEWDVPNTLLAGVTIGVKEKTQNTFNQNC